VGGLSTLVVARGDDFADALAASSMAKAVGGHPLGLTPQAALPEEMVELLATHGGLGIAGIMGDDGVV
jgi:hypothetical protein